MTNNASYSGFLSLPLELRDEIYRHLLPDVDDICPIRRSRRQLHNIKDFPCLRLPCLRLDDDQCSPEILAVNKQINAEASRVLYARTYTMKFSMNKVIFLGREYARKPLDDSAKHRWEDFLLRFPFHKVQRLRLGISTIESPPPALYTNLSQFVEVVNRAGHPLKRLSIEVRWSFDSLWRPARYGKPNLQDLRHLFRVLKFRASSCEIYFPPLLKDCLESIHLAKECGREITAGKSEPAVFVEDLVLIEESLRERLVASL